MRALYSIWESKSMLNTEYKHTPPILPSILHFLESFGQWPVVDQTLNHTPRLWTKWKNGGCLLLNATLLFQKFAFLSFFGRPLRIPCLAITFFQLFRLITLALPLTHTMCGSHPQIPLARYFHQIQNLRVFPTLHGQPSGQPPPSLPWVTATTPSPVSWPSLVLLAQSLIFLLEILPHSGCEGQGRGHHHFHLGSSLSDGFLAKCSSQRADS